MQRVICRSCGAALSPGARFCAACGTPVDASCAACGAVLPPGARFCATCGHAVAERSAQPAAGAEPTGQGRERKVAALLFADLVGSTTLGETHDPEVVGSLVSDVFDRLGAEVARYEGTVENRARRRYEESSVVPVLGDPVEAVELVAAGRR
jgi:ribosomal protein L40E